MNRSLFGTPRSTSRRDALRRLLFATVAVPALARAADPGHEHHHAPNGRLVAVIDALFACTKAGQRCDAHCQQTFESGDTALAECDRTVRQMLPVCSAAAELAAQQAHDLSALLAVCITVCEECEQACHKHADEHAECKACGEACTVAIKAMKDYLAG